MCRTYRKRQYSNRPKKKRMKIGSTKAISTTVAPRRDSSVFLMSMANLVVSVPGRPGVAHHGRRPKSFANYRSRSGQMPKCGPAIQKKQDATGDGDQPMWTCAKCRQEIEDDYEVCWACGTSVEGDEDPHFFDERRHESPRRPPAPARPRKAW